MKTKLLFFFLLFTSLLSFANDGAFFASGNHLIPISETDIRIQKEILTLKKVDNKIIEVTVYYEFFNPKEEKTITVGFEALAPSGDVDGGAKNGRHPYMRDFTVHLNNTILAYKVAYVADTGYHQKGTIKTIDLTTFSGNTSGNNIDFFYVYHFKAKFKKGLNIIKHTYNYDASGSIDYNYYFEYVLTAANRWGNRQIDDFTLIIDNGEFETFSISNTFFTKGNEWLINGLGKAQFVKGNPNAFVTNDATQFYMQKGNLIFQKKNFKPKGELFLYSRNYFGSEDFSYLPFSYYLTERIPKPENDLQRKILKNLPFARRGYVFQNSALNEFFKTQEWYLPNPNYTPEVELLTKMELDWMARWK